MTGLCDCNSFYASCEKLFRPDLRGKPVIVLSNNDGCVVSSTEEAKALGVTRGGSYRSIKDELAQKGVFVFSSNYPLYQDISDRVMDMLRNSVESVQPYSIDEAFFEFGDLPRTERQWEAYERRIRAIHRQIEKQSGVPISIGIARNKTLAKLANHIGKVATEIVDGENKRKGYCVLRPEQEMEILRRTPLAHVWGIGYRRAEQLYHLGLRTAWDLIRKDDRWIEKHCTATGLQTAWELRGRNVIDTEKQQLRTLCSGITFSNPKSSFEEVAQSLSCHCMTLAGKLWVRNLQATNIAIHIFTNRFQENYCSLASQQSLDSPTAYPPALYRSAKKALQEIWQQGRPYAGSRIWITDFIPEGRRQYNLFETEEIQKKREREDRFTEAIEEVERTYGKRALLSGASDLKVKLDLSCQQHLSPHYTTRWSDLPKASSGDIDISCRIPSYIGKPTVRPGSGKPPG
jgi:DNA polymerase V